MNYNINLLMKVHNTALSTHIMAYLENISDASFVLMANEIGGMLLAEISNEIIYNNIITILLMHTVVKKYDVVANYKKIDKILELIYPTESERKKLLIQTLAYCIKLTNPQPETIIVNMVNVVNPELFNS